MRKVGLDRMMWGSDYPHHESTYPYTTEGLRLAFADWEPDDVRQVTSRTAAGSTASTSTRWRRSPRGRARRVDEVKVPLDEVPPTRAARRSRTDDEGPAHEPGHGLLARAAPLHRRAEERRWYTTVLSAERMTAADDDSYVALRANRIVLVLSERPAGTPASGPLDHLAFAVPDGAALETWAAHLTEQGIVHDGIVLELGKPSLQMLDPDGIAIELVAPPVPG